MASSGALALILVVELFGSLLEEYLMKKATTIDTAIITCHIDAVILLHTNLHADRKSVVFQSVAYMMQEKIVWPRSRSDYALRQLK